MRNANFRGFFAPLMAIALIVVIGIAATPTKVPAHEYTLGTLLIKHPMARPTPPVAKNGAVFLEITDQNGEGDALLSVATPNAAKSEIHLTTVVDNVARMARQEKVDVAPGETVSFKPGGLHIMLMGLTGPLVKGEEFPLTLNFEKSGSVEVVVKIEDYHEHGDAKDADSKDADKGHHGSHH